MKKSDGVDLVKLSSFITDGGSDSDSLTLAYPRYVTFESELSRGKDDEQICPCSPEWNWIIHFRE